MILLAPAVSVGYDVRAAVRSAREGMDVFCSKKDWVALGFVASRLLERVPDLALSVSATTRRSRCCIATGHCSPAIRTWRR